MKLEDLTLDTSLAIRGLLDGFHQAKDFAKVKEAIAAGVLNALDEEDFLRSLKLYTKADIKKNEAAGTKDSAYLPAGLLGKRGFIRVSRLPFKQKGKKAGYVVQYFDKAGEEIPDHLAEELLV